jgi:hypothetical protein
MRSPTASRGALLALVVLATIGLWLFARQLSIPGRAARADDRAVTDLAAPPPPMELFGTMGKEGTLVPGKETVLFEQPGAGTLTHMWFGGSWPAWGDTRIRVFVDGEAEPGIDMALFLGHGVGWGDDSAPWGTNRSGKTGHPSGVYNTYRIPFGKGVKVTARLAPEVRAPQTFWWIVRGLTNHPVKLAGMTLPPAARLRLHRRENVALAPLEEVAVLDTDRKGLVYAVTFAARSGNFNDLEACLRAYPNGRKDPVWLSSGTEDYFLGTYYFNAGPYHLPIAGLTHMDPDRPGSLFRFSAYRFHEDDPLPFQNGMRLVWRNGEELGGKRFGDPKPSTFTSYVWAYEW